MPAYSKEDYEADVEQLAKLSRDLSWADISSLQSRSLKLFDDVQPPFVRREVFRAPTEDDTRAQLLAAIDALQAAPTTFEAPQYVDVSAEWVFASAELASRRTTSSNEHVLFYLHGGGFIYGSPGTARRATRVLASLTGYRCLAIQYRHATVQPFPAQLLDALVAYFSLLSESRSDRSILFAGESSGLNMLMAMVQVLLHLQKHSPKVAFNGKDLEIRLPAAVTGLSGFFDVTSGLPSWTSNGRWDVLPEVLPTYTPEWPDQQLWPTEPPRADVYCDRPAMTHPLVSPVTAESWQGAPPFFIAIGEERNADANLYLAQTAARQGVAVRLERWEHMTHVWPTGLPKLPHSKRVLQNWASFCVAVARGEKVTTGGKDISFATLDASSFDVLDCTTLTRDDVLRYLGEAQEARMLIQRKGGKARI